MTDRELLDHANRSLGFKSLGAKLRERLETALAVALTRRLLARTGDVIRPGDAIPAGGVIRPGDA